jgi:hypothetical protein
VIALTTITMGYIAAATAISSIKRVNRRGAVFTQSSRASLRATRTWKSSTSGMLSRR